MNWFKLIRDKLDMEKILALRGTQYTQPLFLEGISLPNGQESSGEISLSSLGSFLVLGFTGKFTTLMVKSAVAPLTLKDLGVCSLRFKIQAGASTLQLFGDYVPMDLMLSPGRVRTAPTDGGLITGGYTLADADIGPVPNQLFYPYTWVFPFASNDVITVKVKNDLDASTSGWANRWSITFLGIRARYFEAAMRETEQRPTTQRK
jgi:hypothetical protein